MSDFRTWYAVQPRAIRLLLTINVVAYLVWQLLLRHIDVTNAFVWNHLAFDPALPGLLFQPWKILTYAFLHLNPGLNGLLHILFNMLWLVWIGRDFENIQGPAPLFSVYVLSAIGGALLTVLLNALFPGVALFSALVHGASGGVLGVMACVALLYPHQRISLLFIGSVRLLHVVLGFVALDILFLSASGTAVAAHAGGVLTGFLYARLQQKGIDAAAWARPLFAARPVGRGSFYGSGRSQGTSLLERMEAWLSRRMSSSGGRSSSAGRPSSSGGSSSRSTGVGSVIRGDGPSRRGDAGTTESSPRPGLRRVIPGLKPNPDAVDEQDPSANIDRILDKISEQGYDALTAEEKRILYEASQK